MKSTELPQSGFMRLSQILPLIPIGRSTFWCKVRSGEYPQPIKLGTKTSVWLASDIQELIDSLAEGRPASFTKRGDHD